MKSKLTPLSINILKGLFAVIVIGFITVVMIAVVQYNRGLLARVDALEDRPVTIVKEVRVEVTATPSAKPTVKVVKPVLKPTK